MTVQGVLFDFFGTLVDYDSNRTGQNFPLTFELLVSYGAQVDYPHFMSIGEEVFSELDNISSESGQEYSMIQVAEALAVLVNIDVNQQQLARLAASYTDEWSKSVVPIPGIEKFLTNLGRSYRLGLITNTHDTAMIMRLMDEMKISELFEVITTSIDHGNPKPHGAIFEDTLDRMGISSKAAIYVGDNYHADYLGANQAGMTCYLIGSHARVPVEYQIATVLDLPLHQLH